MTELEEAKFNLQVLIALPIICSFLCYISLAFINWSFSMSEVQRALIVVSGLAGFLFGGLICS